MAPPDLSHVLGIVQSLVTEHAGLRLLVLHGSRARGEPRADSDWDFAYIANSPFDPAMLQADLTLALATDEVDLADLASASGLLRYRVARDGILLFEAQPGRFERFWFEAVSFWCDAAPVLRAGFKTILDDLGP